MYCKKAITFQHYPHKIVDSFFQCSVKKQLKFVIMRPNLLLPILSLLSIANKKKPKRRKKVFVRKRPIKTIKGLFVKEEKKEA